MGWLVWLCPWCNWKYRQTYNDIWNPGAEAIRRLPTPVDE